LRVDDQGRRVLTIENDYQISRNYKEKPIWSGIYNFAA
jgi:hypothetical protein